MSRKKPLIKNRVPEAVEQATLRLAVEFSAYGQLRAANEPVVPSSLEARTWTSQHKGSRSSTFSPRLPLF